MELLFLFKRAMKKIQVSFILFIFLIFEKRVSMELKIKKNTKLTAEALVGVAVSKLYILKGTQDYILHFFTQCICSISLLLVPKIYGCRNPTTNIAVEAT